MFLVDKKLQKTKLIISLLAILHSHGIHAGPASSTTLNSPAINSNNALSDASDTNSLAWPLLPGESISTLSALFYPKNQAMQQRFVTRTLQLNQQAGRSWDAEAKVNIVELILIPDIKALGKNSGKIQHSHAKKRKKSHSESPQLHLSYQLKDTSLFIVSEQLQQDYDHLFKRNTSLKSELEKLNNKLQQLQLILAGLKMQAIDLLNRVPEQISSDTVQPKPIKVSYQNPPPQLFPATFDTAKKTVFDPLYLWGLMVALLSIIAVVLAWRAYNQRQAKDLYLAATGDFDPLKTGIFDQQDQASPNLTKVDFSLTQNGLDESMSVVDLSEVQGLDYTEEGELILEQARIYVNIGRVDEATDLLKAQIQAMPKASLHHWLYLLDIYRDHHQQSEFMQYAKLLHETFNVMMPLWDNATLPIVIASSLEEFPHIVKNLTGLWASPEPLTDAQAYIEELLMDNRESERTGFSMEVFQELVMLRDLLAVRAKMAASM